MVTNEIDINIIRALTQNGVKPGLVSSMHLFHTNSSVPSASVLYAANIKEKRK